MSDAVPEPPVQGREACALLVIDLQRGLFKRPIYRAQELLNAISLLVDRAHRAGAPVFLAQHANESTLVEGSDDWQFHPQIRPTAADTIIHKRQGSAFEGTTLKEQLENGGVGTLVVTGLVTRGCVRATCLHARRLGYEVILVEDGHSTFHRQAVQRIAALHGELRDQGIAVTAAQNIVFERPSSL